MPTDPFGEPEYRTSLHPAGLEEEALLGQCTLVRGRTGGPGGQHRNRVATEVTLRHEPTGLCARAGERRSPETNRRVALRRLRYTLAVEHRTGVGPGEARTPLWASRCDRRGRIACNERHPDHPALIAEALDVAAACGWDTSRAATRLCCSHTQLVRLIASHPPALQSLNARRASRGLHPLRP
jgi:hypothetical protein